MIYQSAAGFDNVGGLTALVVQPACDGINYPLWTPTAKGSEPVGHALAVLRYSSLLDSEYPSVLAAHGLSSANNAERTMTLPTKSRVAGTFNVIISRPKRERYNDGYYRDVEFEIRIIEEL